MKKRPARLTRLILRRKRAYSKALASGAHPWEAWLAAVAAVAAVKVQKT